MELSNKVKSTSVSIGIGDNPRNAVGGLLRHAMNRVQTRQSADIPMTADMASALGIPVKKTSKASTGRTTVASRK